MNAIAKRTAPLSVPALPHAPAALAAINIQPPKGVNALPTPITNTTDIESLAEGILLWIFWGLIIFSIIMFLIGGYKYATSAGESERVRSANKTLLYAAIAALVAIVAFGIPILISNFLGGPAIL